MATDWKWRLYLLVPLAMNTAQNRQGFAAVFADNGSGETVENEAKLFDSVARLATVAVPLVQVGYGISTLVKSDMRAAMEAFLAGLNAGLTGVNRAQWYAVANRDLANFIEGELIASTRNNASILARIGDGTAFTWQDALDDLGLVVM